VKTPNRTAAGVFVSKNGTLGHRPSDPRPANEVGVSVEERTPSQPVAPSSSVSKAPRHRLHPSGGTSKVEKLVCRYCGSDDLAPSFRKRRDARCRACFKKRYSSASRAKNDRRVGRAKAAK
jgi:hypothetical protein